MRHTADLFHTVTQFVTILSNAYNILYEHPSILFFEVTATELEIKGAILK